MSLMSRHARVAATFAGFCFLYSFYLYFEKYQWDAGQMNHYIFPVFYLSSPSTFEFLINLWTCVTLIVWIWFGVAWARSVPSSRKKIQTEEEV
ncbi:hypothetical protein ACOJUR_04920 [Alicyclobacillus tolerans]|uniref:Uncharacterized protein n=2 Tax=Alicyclobacillus tolerans TaxID=90970 RepID=A0A1M6UWD1_9BACL|nr:MULTISPECIES: hypothetical protein [Alicyclobacillus]MDP9729725.1 hypothetical protein [Alicyclobacillus tengchongensis]QRF22849.1 hypothetical protein FY534_03510 [Alicyclobacillus sp. TC]SHK73562.1 hypothetical protein SAMN05443507_12125 [Alicyclobacillus montanus]